MKFSIHHTFVAIQIQGETFDKYKSLYIPSHFDPLKNACVYGLCIAAPERLLYFQKEINAIKNEFGGTINAPLDRADEIRDMTARSALFDVDVEIQAGDFILFKYNVYYSAKNEGRIFKNKDGYFILIPYDSCYIAFRNDEVIPLNGLVLLEPVLEKSNSKIQVEAQESALMGKIAHMGTKVRSYLQYPDDFDCDYFNVGDTVMFRKNSAVVFEDSLHRKLDKKYLRLWRRDLLGKVN